MNTLTKVCAGMVTAGLLLPAAAFAQSTSMQTLLDQIKALQAQIMSLQTQQKTLIQERNDAVKTLMTTLKQGAEGEDVQTLQALLAADAEVYPEGRITGFFGALTAQAVKRFQKKNGLEQVGNVGPKTLAKLNDMLGKNPIAFENATSTDGMSGKGPKRPCAAVPPGHLIAPGWLKKHDGVMPIVPPCQKLPPGIANQLGATTTPPTPPADTTAPIISSIAVSGISSTTATVTWTTNENATGKVYYGTSTPITFGSESNVGTGSMMNHSAALTGLMASTTYYIAIQAKDAANNTATTSTTSFITQ